ncbi:MAG: hypothetical protein V4488_07155 [Pseudomonadota bacterium]
MQIPSEQDWGDYESDLDQEYAHRIFFGKNLEETIPAFERNVIERADELHFMPLKPFRYYMLGFRDYVMSERVLKSDMVPDAASCFLGLVILKLCDAADFINPIMGELMPAIEYVAANQSRFDADIDIYGDFAEKLAEIKSLMI